MDLEKIKMRLKSLGYEVMEDDQVIEFTMDKTEQYIKHFCNIEIIPDCLEYVFIDIVCGEILRDKKATGQLTSMQLEQVVKRITDGDTTVEMATGNSSGDGRFDSLVKKLINGHTDTLIHHRQLRW